MKKFTKILSMLLVVMMFVSVLGTTAFAGYERIDGSTGSTGSVVSTGSAGGVEAIGGSTGTTGTTGTTGGIESIGGSTGTTSTTGTAGYESLDGSGDPALVTESGSTGLLGAPLDASNPFYIGANTNTYTTLQAAENDLGAGGTINLGVNATMTAGATIAKNTVLDLGGKTLTMSTFSITVSPTIIMTIQNGTITGGTAFAVVSDGATLNLNNVTVESSGLTINGTGSTKGKVYISGGTYCAGIAQAGVTITSGSFATTNPETAGATLADGSSVTTSATPFIVTAGASTGGPVTVNGVPYPNFDQAYAVAASSGSTIELSANQSTARTTIDKSVTLALGTNTLTFSGGGGVTITGGHQVTVTGGAITGNISIDGSAGLTLQSGSPVIGNVTNNGTLTLSGYRAQAGTVSGDGVTNIYSGIVNTLNLSSASKLNMSGGDSSIGTLFIPNSTTVEVNVSGGTVNTATIPSFTVTPKKTVSGGVWKNMSDANVANLGLITVNGYSVTKVAGTTNDYQVGAGAGTGSGGSGSGGTGGSVGGFSATPTRSDLYVYNPNVSQGDVSYSFNVQMPAGGTLNSVQYVSSNGITTATSSSWTAGSTSFTVSLYRGYMADLPAGTTTVRFNFSGGSVDAVTLYVLPVFGIVPSGSTVYFSVSDPNGIGAYSVHCGNVTSVGSAYQLNSGSDYTYSGSTTSQTLTLTTTGLTNINRGTGSSTYNVWYGMGGYAFPMGSFTMNNGTITNPTGSTGNPGSTSSGDIYVSPAAGSTWVSGDGDMGFYTSSIWPLAKAWVDSTQLNTLNWDTVRKAGYFYLDDAMLATLGRGVHTVTVSNTAGQSGSCTFYIGPSLVPKETTKHTTGSRLNLRYVCSDPIYQVFVGNVWIDPAYYGLSSDRKTLTLYADLLNARTAGLTYQLGVDVDNAIITKNASDADAFNSFTILTTAQAAASPRTGDDSNLALWAALMGVTGVAAIVVVPKMKKRED